ncbi:uncharacterized protein KGF55_001325 [Candida pseudojiufengensis]|uniref:uncharacterized protein n=1 Tax=Candida pseudojiufengensis TaxID=497109 RepID=UPI002225241B|nr:uncharacterized protein KGF55_001325 [Candida pseudojiufengensis]KAI5965961.1 hypothetical protein KGF55_001325 [Candida pseudojiufengensis]
MLVFYQKYYTPLDRFINKLKRKGFWLYTGMIALSVFYLMYEISNLPSLPPPPPSYGSNTKVQKDHHHTKVTKITKTEKVIPKGEDEADQPEVIVEETIIES